MNNPAERRTPGKLPAALVDAHHHFWTASPYFGGTDYLPENYLTDVGPLCSGLDATVFAECHTNYDALLPDGLQPLGETRFAAEIGSQHASARARLAAAIVGHADPLASGATFEQIIDAQLVAGAGRLRAIRRSVAWDENSALNYSILRTHAHMLADPRFVQALQVLADRKVAFETWLYHPQLDELTTLARAVPDCTIVLNHAGTPLASGPYSDLARTWSDWTSGMARLSSCSNVHVKIGGFITSGSRLDAIRRDQSLDSWTVDALAESLEPWLAHVLRYFGAERCLFESNFPVDKPRCTFPVLVEAYSQALRALDDAARDAIFHGNATRLYRLDEDDR